MCGIIGVYHDHFKIDDYKRVMSVLNHRGPDSCGYYDDGKVLFVHNRLSIIDLSEAANQPMIDDETGNVLIFNGEIYNYKELKKEYPNITWKTNSDTEVILKLYAYLGKGFVEKLTGIFAFAIFDKKENKILLYRDRVGVKPLYFSRFGDDFAFSSELRGILQFHRPNFNLKVIHDYLEYGLAYGEETFFEDIFSLDPGCILEWDINKKELSKYKYWDVTSEDYCFELNDEDILHKTHELLKKSVELNLESDVEVAVSLSSGLDSTLLLNVLKNFKGKVKAFSFGYADEKYDEIRVIKENLDPSVVDFYPVYLDKDNFLACLKEAVALFEMPIGGLGTVSSYNMMKEVRRRGIKVLLAGEGADEVFSGYQYFYPAFFFDIQNNPGLLKKELAFYSENHGTNILPFSKEYSALLEPLKADTVLASDGTKPAQTHTSTFLRERFKEYQVKSKQKRFFSSKLKEAMFMDLTLKKLPKLLHFQDRASMANGVETRVPFLDHNIINFIYSLPSTYKIRDGKNKFLLREIMSKYYGAKEQRKTKHYLSAPQREWLKEDKACKEILDTVRNGVLVKNNFIDFERFEQDYLAYSKSPELGNSFFVWKIINLEFLLSSWVGN